MKKMSACVTMVEANWKIQMEEKTYVYYDSIFYVGVNDHQDRLV